MFNCAVFSVVAMYIGGDAVNGRVRAGHCYAMDQISTPIFVVRVRRRLL
jgi:hypothetical protein